MKEKEKENKKTKKKLSGVAVAFTISKICAGLNQPQWRTTRTNNKTDFIIKKQQKMPRSRW